MKPGGHCGRSGRLVSGSQSPQVQVWERLAIVYLDVLFLQASHVVAASFATQLLTSVAVPPHHPTPGSALGWGAGKDYGM